MYLYCICHSWKMTIWPHKKCFAPCQFCINQSMALPKAQIWPQVMSDR